MRYFGRVLIVALAFALVAGVTLAQETTGSLQGHVLDANGTPIAGAIVEATGPLGKVNTTTDAVGKYRFPRVAAGTYVAVASLAGYKPSKAENVRVNLGVAVTVDFTLESSTFAEEILVYSDTKAIDFTESATTTSIREWEIEYLPRGRNFTSVAGFAAGAAVSDQGGGLMIDGASGLENKFIIDGLDTTDPEDGYSKFPMRAEFFEEVQVKSAGYMAEFGGAMGGVINAVTKSGGNEFHGSVFADYENNSWNGSQRQELEWSLTDPDQGELRTYERDDMTRIDPGFSLGGPILKDRWWFFASYQPGLRTIDRNVHWQSYPAEVYTQDFQIDYTTFNTTFNLGSSLLLKGGLNFSPYTTEGRLPNPDGLADQPDQEDWAPLGVEGERETYYLNADWIVNDNFVISARGGFYHVNANDTGVPIVDWIVNYSTISGAGFLDKWPEIPSEWQQSAGFTNNPWVTVRFFDIYERTAFGADGTLFFSAAGDHSLKFGYQNEEITNDVRQAYNGDYIRYYWDRSYTTTTGESVRGEYGYFRLLNIATLGEVKTKNQALFIQDTWTVVPNLTLNIGFRFENEEVPNYGSVGPQPAIAFGWGDKIAPRLGFAWDVTGEAKWKLYGSVGQYYDVTKYEMPRGAFGGATWVDYFYTFDTANPGLNQVEGCHTGSNTISERPNCPAGTLIEPVDRRHNAANPEEWEYFGVPLIDPDIKPMENYEAQLGLEYQLTSTIQLGARVVHKEIRRAIEDIGFLFPGIGEVYIIGNPGEGSTAGEDENGLSFPKPERDYNALELTLTKRFSDNWSLRAYYTLSRLEGNYSGLANSDEVNSVWSQRQAVGAGARRSPNVSRLYDSILAFYNEDGEHVYGRLATDRTHQLGAQFMYTFDFGLNVGVNQYIGSGTPISTVGSLPIGNDFYPFGRGDLGDTSWLTQTDLTLVYTLTFGRNLGLSFGLTVLNLLDEDTATGVWPHTGVQDVPVDPSEVATGFDYAAELAALGPTALDPRHGLDYAFQLPREVRFTVKFEF